MTMRRRGKEITDQAQIDAITAKAQVCRLAMRDGGQPYVVSLCFGRDGTALYMHHAPDGRKLDVLRRNPNVCFETTVDTELVKGAEACKWSFRYRSVIGEGTATIIDDLEGKRAVLAIIIMFMNQYSNGAYDFPRDVMGRIIAIRVNIITMT